MRLLKLGALYGVLAAACFFYLLPIWWAVTTSLKNRVDTYTRDPVLFFIPTFENYGRVVERQDFGLAFLNSLTVAVAVTVIVMYVGALSAYALTRFRFRGETMVALAIIAARMFPPISLLPAFYLLVAGLSFFDRRLVDWQPTLVFAHAIYGLPFVVFLLVGFFYQVPRELDEAALIDGCSRMGVFHRVMLPSIAPGLAATAILAFVYSWNEFLFALVLTRQAAKTLPVTASEFLTFVAVDWQGLTALATMLMVPGIVIALAAQRYLVRGLTAGAVKG